MKRIKTVICVICVLASLGYSQSSSNNYDLELRKAVLLSDLKTLALEVPKLDGPLARAFAKAEIADAAWTLDRNWALKLLKEAYELTYLTEEEMRKVGTELMGSAPAPPSAIGRARMEVRKRILSVARRDRVFADRLLKDSSVRVTKDDRQMMYAQIARMALEEGDNKAAVHSIEQNISIDPTRMIYVELINDLAIKDRDAADKLILECIANLSSIRPPEKKIALARATPTLMWLVFPNSFFSHTDKKIPSPGADVMRAYVRYVIEYFSAMNRDEPGSLKSARGILLTAWFPLNQYAPELKDEFMQLESLTRTAGKDASLPTKSNEELEEERVRKQKSDALNADQPSDHFIDSMISRGEFETARKLIDKLPEGERKAVLTEQVNAKEAVSLAQKGDLLTSQNLAEQLTRVGSILQVYPLIVQGYVAKKDQTGASAAVHQAMQRLKAANTQPVSSSIRAGMPVEFRPTANEIDGVLSAMTKLAKAVLPIHSLLASEVIDDVVARANASQIDTSQGRTGFDSDLFKSLASKDEIRARSAAESFKDRLRRIVALAAIYQWKAKVLERALLKAA